MYEGKYYLPPPGAPGGADDAGCGRGGGGGPVTSRVTMLAVIGPGEETGSAGGS